MGMTMSEKILAQAAGKASAKAGDILWVKVDKAMMDDVLGPRVEIAEKLKELNVGVWDKDKIVVISDHYTPPANATQAAIVKFTRDWCSAYGVDNYYEFVGPCHQIMVEKGHVLPGQIIVGTDSHTCMYGALGSFSTGIGSTEMLGVLVTGEIWLKVPETVKVEWSGNLPKGTMAKDLVLKTIGKVGHVGATYKAIEYVGNTIENMIMDERMAITNMAVEMGAKAGLIPVDNITLEYLKERNINQNFDFLKSDKEAHFCDELRFNAEELEPVAACPHEVDNVTEIKNIEGTKIDQAYIGSCTGGRYNDLLMAAKVLEGKKIAKGIRLLVSPSSKDIWDRCAKDGILQKLSDAGAVILSPTCGVCLGLHSGTIAPGEVCISSTNRNFIGRMGSADSQIYLASPISVAAAAIEGKIADPRKYL
ncbi:3-isopropylmalate dehydratase large subunit [Geosporobacter ferrireducens]|uniref:3-isopropylmalate dehydratase large subunit n=1 Tax=Geosporobacter ferrireducens TaxID=1424294 RepID=A0A1D8GFD1_9FIRM|nr:3-isopropylmalate dehydratase large subunit [Geosporobacter ferrireducens]AOT69608.1 3-isopropylmalate dehydratase large subunit [Geosporobacter ferrireducens]MTI54692.1 3-isopropylmalate dehydratase large subunit [Geosporobacter ferrireducens]